MTVKNLLFLILVSLSYYGSSQMVYTEVNPTIELCSSSQCDTNAFEIDFNNDNAPDLLLWFDSYKVGSGCIGSQFVQLFSMLPTDTAELLMDSSGELAYLNYLDTVKSSDSLSFQEYYCDNGDYYECEFLISATRYDCEETPSQTLGHYYSFWEKYIGFKLQIAGQYHYCWIKVMKTIGVNLELMAYAYNATPNEELVINDPNYSSVQTSELDGVKVYPNPFEDEVSIESESSTTKVEVVDLLGNIIHLNNYNASQIKISTHDWSKGVYLIRVSSGLNYLVKRVVKN